MMLERPDLSQVDPAVQAYIEALEEELAYRRAASEAKPSRARNQGKPAAAEEEVEELAAPPEPSEPPTTLQVITVSASGLAKRTPRHLYGRQRRGGMGIFDLDSPVGDPPQWLLIADEADSLVLLTNQARAFRVAVATLPTSPIRSRGQSLFAALGLYPGEQVVALLPGQRSTYAAILCERGWVVCVAGQFFTENLRPTNVLYDYKKYGAAVAACWVRSEQDLLMLSQHGLGVRLAVKKVPAQGCVGMRLDPDDVATAITTVESEGSVFLVSADGKGSVRLMPGFAAMKGPGTGGKAALKTDHLVGATSVAAGDDLFLIARSGKLIRFSADEVPPKEGVVQGVNCMSLRSDEVVALAVGKPLKG
jgi:DNA gyrase subunit A